MNHPPKLLVSQPDLGPAEADAVQAVLQSHWVGMGPRTAAFEAALSDYLGVRHVVATSSCTAALHLALAALERDHRHQVIVPSLTFAATVQAILMAGYQPVFADVNAESLTLDPDDVARLVTDRTRAILPVHLAGYPCDLSRLRALAKPAGIPVVEDAAHAFGSTCEGAPIGRLGHAVCFSFSSNKNITCGEGGAIATDSNTLASRARQMRYLGISRDTWQRQDQSRPWEYSVAGPGFRCHLSDVHASIGLAQLQRLPEFAARRRRLASIYDTALAPLHGLAPVRRDLAGTIPNLYIVRVTKGRRDRVFERLLAAGILCGVHYSPNHLQPAFQAYARPLPVTEHVAGEILSLPLHTRLTDADAEWVAEELQSALESDLIPTHTPAAAAVG